MPELPEVETIRLSLEKNLVGKVINSVTVLEPKQFVGDKNLIIGQSITSIERKGKVISIKLSNYYYISIHLKLSGQLLYGDNKDQSTFKNIIPRANSTTLPSSTTRIVIGFNDNSGLFFNDLRKFGWIKLGKNPEFPPSIDVLSEEFTPEYFKSIVNKSGKPIKVLLMEQDKLAGIGNIYANDSLWEAKINPLRKANTLTADETNQLYNAIKKTISESLRLKGSSAKDELYVLPDSSKGEYQNHFKVYHRDGKPCLRDNTMIMRVKQAGRGTFYCPTCQQ
jgi:formamidopyrimidine-DNA glycosylase